MDNIGGISHNLESLQMPSLRKYPSLTAFSKDSKKSFVDIMDQFLSSDPGITVQGKYYKDKGSSAALMTINNFLNDNQNITADFTKLSDAGREMEKNVEKLVS